MSAESSLRRAVDSLDDLSARLRLLRVQAGSPSYTEIARRVTMLRSARGRPSAERKPGRVTIYDCFKPGRSRWDVELVVEIAEVLGADEPGWWRQAYGLVSGESVSGSIISAGARLPDRLAEFTGRRVQLTEVLQSAAGRRGPRLIAIEGMAGVGKTQFAVQAGHQLLEDRDAALFVNLRGYDPEEPPADPRAVLGSFLRLLGVRSDHFQHLGVAQRSFLYRQTLGTRRALILLDNAVNEDQVVPLLPSGSDSAVLVTSRHRLAGLAAAEHVALGVFSHQESVDYLIRMVGPERVEAEPAAADELVELCGHLPLSLGLTAAELQRKPVWSLTDHVRRLQRFPRDDAIRSVLAASYRSLASPVQRLFRLLALHPGRDRVDSFAAAALGGMAQETAEDLLQQLWAEHLLQRTSPGYYQFHDLLRAYAERMVNDQDADSEQRAALTRLLDHYAHAASAALDTVLRRHSHRSPPGSESTLPAGVLGCPTAALSWLDAERANLVSAAGFAAGNGWPAHACRLAAVLDNWPDAAARPEGEQPGRPPPLDDAGEVSARRRPPNHLRSVPGAMDGPRRARPLKC